MSDLDEIQITINVKPLPKASSIKVPLQFPSAPPPSPQTLRRRFPKRAWADPQMNLEFIQNVRRYEAFVLESDVNRTEYVSIRTFRQ